MIYDELGGRGVIAAYAIAIGHDCPSCLAKMGQYCVNPITGKARHVPCELRTRARTGGSPDAAEKS